MTKQTEALALVNKVDQEQPAQQEPVYVYTCKGCKALFWENDLSCDCTVNGLFEFDRHVLSEDTSPPAQRTWVGLTDEDIKEAEWLLSAIKEHEAYTLQEQLIVEGVDVFARAIEAKLKEKNSD